MKLTDIERKLLMLAMDAAATDHEITAAAKKFVESMRRRFANGTELVTALEGGVILPPKKPYMGGFNPDNWQSPVGNWQDIMRDAKQRGERMAQAAYQQRQQNWEEYVRQSYRQAQSNFQQAQQQAYRNMQSGWQPPFGVGAMPQEPPPKAVPQEPPPKVKEMRRAAEGIFEKIKKQFMP